jgi:hypothetical protein
LPGVRGVRYSMRLPIAWIEDEEVAWLREGCAVEQVSDLFRWNIKGGSMKKKEQGAVVKGPSLARRVDALESKTHVFHPNNTPTLGGILDAALPSEEAQLRRLIAQGIDTHVRPTWHLWVMAACLVAFAAFWAAQPFPSRPCPQGASCEYADGIWEVYYRPTAQSGDEDTYVGPHGERITGPKIVEGDPAGTSPTTYSGTAGASQPIGLSPLAKGIPDTSSGSTAYPLVQPRLAPPGTGYLTSPKFIQADGLLITNTGATKCWLSLTNASGKVVGQTNLEPDAVLASDVPITVRSGCPGALYYEVNGKGVHAKNLARHPESVELVKLLP